MPIFVPSSEYRGPNAVAELFAGENPERVIHLAAQAGVRYSLTNPHAYIDANIQGFINILEGCRHEIGAFSLREFIFRLRWQ